MNNLSNFEELARLYDDTTKGNKKPKQDNRISKIVAFVIIFLGVIVAAIPIYTEVYRWYWEQELLKEFNQGENIVSENADAQNQILTVASSPSVAQKNTLTNILGVLEIKKINLKLPVLQGTTNSVLDRAGGHMSESDMPGKEGNCAIAAHRSYTFGRFFNRLNELENGDTVSLRVASKVYNYVAYNKIIVLPEDTSVLERQKGETILTLITCDPMKNPTHRLIVHCKLVK